MTPQEFANKMKTVCLHGRVLTNPYTGRLVYVPCGTCDACLANKATNNELRVNAQTNFSRFCYFVTLTYNAETIPTYKIACVSVGEDTNVYSCTAIPRMSVNRTVTMFPNNPRLRRKKVVPVSGLSKFEFESFTFVASSRYVEEYSSQADLSFVKGVQKYPQYAGTYGWLNWQDVSLYMKRVRKYLYSKLNRYETLHTYIVGEYGPKTFRPHFHLLLFFDSEEVASCIGQALSSCWRLGRVDWSSSFGDAQRYVAGYTNAFSSLPYHIRESRQLRSRGRFSNRFGFEFFKDSIERARRGDFFDFINGKQCIVNGKSKTVYPWRSLIDSVFFRFASRDDSTKFELSRIIFAVCSVMRRHGCFHQTAYGAVRRLYWYIYDHLSPFQRVEYLKGDTILNDISEYINLPFVNAPDADYKNSFYSRWYTLFHSVLVFLDGNNIDWRDKNTRPYHLWQLLQNSINFYKQRDYESLVNSLKDCESIALDSAYILVRQEEKTNEKFLNTSEGKLSQTLLSQHIWRNTKHRELNDRNIKFVTYGAL